MFESSYTYTLVCRDGNNDRHFVHGKIVAREIYCYKVVSTHETESYISYVVYFGGKLDSTDVMMCEEPILYTDDLLVVENANTLCSILYYKLYKIMKDAGYIQVVE